MANKTLPEIIRSIVLSTRPMSLESTRAYRQGFRDGIEAAARVAETITAVRTPPVLPVWEASVTRERQAKLAAELTKAVQRESGRPVVIDQLGTQLTLSEESAQLLLEWLS